MADLVAIQRLLARPEVLFHLPERLNTAIANQDFATAVESYTMASTVLNRYANMTAFTVCRFSTHLPSIASDRF